MIQNHFSCRSYAKKKKKLENVDHSEMQDKRFMLNNVVIRYLFSSI